MKDQAKTDVAGRPDEVTEELIFERVRKVVSETLNKPESDILPESRFAEDLGADSFDNLSLFMMLEEEFDETISEASVEELKSVGSTVKFIHRLIEEGTAPSGPPS